jgi:hypothetical protein
MQERAWQFCAIFDSAEAHGAFCAALLAPGRPVRDDVVQTPDQEDNPRVKRFAAGAFSLNTGLAHADWGCFAALSGLLASGALAIERILPFGPNTALARKPVNFAALS